MKKNALIILLSIITLSCNSDDENTLIVNNNIPKKENIESTLIAEGELYGNGMEGISKQNLVISDQTTWNNLITQMGSVNITDSFLETSIDFSKYKIIAVFDEIKGTGGHKLELEITTNVDNITVKVTDISPEGNATTIVTQPFHIVKITTSNLPILFE